MHPSSTALDRQFAACLQQFDPGMDESVTWAARLASQAVGEGHVCLDLRRYAGVEIEPGQRLPPVTAWQQRLSSSPVVGRPGEFKPLIIEGERLYLARYWSYETQLAARLTARAGESCPDIDLPRLAADLDRLFAHNAGPAIDWQKSAAAIAALRRLCVISGGPGTGKTSTVARLLAALQSQADGGLRIALATPTGKAAARMQDSIRLQKRSLDMPDHIIASIPETASTLHRLLGARPGSVHFRHDRTNPLTVDVVVVDEASMIDLALLSKLLDALPSKARLILLGDKDQLAAVEAGAVFGDICAGRGYRQPFREPLQDVSGVAIKACANPVPLGDCIALLRHSHRFGTGSGIGELARRVNDGEEFSAIQALFSEERHADLAWRPQFSMDDLLERMELGYQAFFDRVAGGAGGLEVLAAFNRFRVLAAHHQGPASADSANRAFEARVRSRRRIPSYERWYPGRPVILLRNDYGLRVFNGDVGVCLRVDGDLRVCFEGTGGKLRSLAPARLPEHEPVYAMTVHKSQGSEFDESLLLLPESISPILNRALVYTAITRARHRAEIWGGPAILAAAVKAAPARSSGLRERLWGANLESRG